MKIIPRKRQVRQFLSRYCSLWETFIWQGIYLQFVTRRKTGCNDVNKIDDQENDGNMGFLIVVHNALVLENVQSKVCLYVKKIRIDFQLKIHVCKYRLAYNNLLNKLSNIWILVFILCILEICATIKKWDQILYVRYKYCVSATSSGNYVNKICALQS